MNFTIILKKIGERIKEIRELNGISQQDLAASCNFEKSNLSRIEAGRSNITVATLFKISQALNTTISDIVNVENNQSNPSSAIDE